jgi:glycosyltransferase involved in cell wall biosynthesis
MKFSIITPSIQRESLVACCESVNNQFGAAWEHIVQIDGSEVDEELFRRIDHPQRFVYVSDRKHGHFGNHARWLAWEKSTGSYLVHCDDDNLMFRPDALADIAHALTLEHFPDWALFPIHRHGSPFLMLPPGMCHTDSANIVVKRELGRWPDIEAREADGVLAEHLANNFAYSAFPDMEPIILMERSSNGV